MAIWEFHCLDVRKLGLEINRTMVYFVEVILPFSLSKTFTYSVSKAEYNYIQVGMRVAVPFGKNKVYTGLAAELHQKPPELYEAKEIHEILDTSPIVTLVQIDFWFWIASYYMCAIGEVFRNAMPSGLLLESETIISFKQNELPNLELTDEEYLIVQALEIQSSLKLNEVAAILNKKNSFPTIQKMIDRGILKTEEEIDEKYKPKLVKYVKLHEQYEADEGLNQLLEVVKTAEKQRQVLLSYFQLSATTKKPIGIKQLVETANTTPAIVNALVKKKILTIYYLQKDRVTYANSERENLFELSENQKVAYHSIQKEFETKSVCLLHGCASSGKTFIYIQLLQNCLQSGKQALLLVPEIALTVQLVVRLQNYFGNQIAVFHSKYNANERVEVWKNVLTNSPKAQIIVGARSSLFLPFQNLDLIIIDEEHEQTYKQVDPAPRFHARDAAIVLATKMNAKVLLGSSTPSIESYYNTQNQKYGLVELSKRYTDSIPPQIELVDLKDAYFRKKMNGHFSQVLIDKINETLALGEQVILYQNRRGFSPILECISCGHVPQCTNCDVSLTYHQFKNQLRCHYCGFSVPKPNHCHSCTSTNLTTKGFGTEQIQQELVPLFPNAKIGRMDQDTTRGKYGLEKIIDAFANKEIDILVGTQMLVKGLDFENLSLVGVMNADNLLHHPDFRALERSFQTLAQVAGRSGRGTKQGRVVIQTYQPKHPIIEQVVGNNYQMMYNNQLHDRNIYYYPPFFKIIKITLKHRDFDNLNQAAQWLFQLLSQHLQMPILGPEEPPINKIRGEYIRTILIKIPKEKSLNKTKKVIQNAIKSFESISQFRSVKTIINVDFY